MKLLEKNRNGIEDGHGKQRVQTIQLRVNTAKIVKKVYKTDRQTGETGAVQTAK